MTDGPEAEAATEEAATEGPTPPWSERFERSPTGQLLISGAIVLVLLALVATHLPASSMQRSVGPTAGEVSRYLGAEMVWGVFAPDPRSTSLQLEAEITFADGTTEVWRPPMGDKVVGHLRHYRWRKWVERVRADDYAYTWEPTARWVAEQVAEPDNPVTEVALVRRFRENSLLDPQPPYQAFTFYTLDLTEEAGS